MAHLKKKALLIAVQDNRVEGFPKLMHAQHDAEQLRCLLTGILKYLSLFASCQLRCL